MRLFDRVAIVGVGLIGGSLALDIKKRRLARSVVGVSRHKSSLQIAKKRRIIDAGSVDLNIIKGSDLIVLATPVRSILSFASAVSALAGPECVVTDVGSTKEEIVEKLSAVIPGFIGSHPLAGSEKRGIAYARGGLFQDSLCIVTPLRSSPKGALGKILALWNAVGARVCTISPRKHDERMAFVSHLPHVLAFALMNSVPERFLPFAPNSLKDTTRIASSDSTLWSDIFLSNRCLLGSMTRLQRQIQALKKAIRQKDAPALLRLLTQAKKKRETLR